MFINLKEIMNLINLKLLGLCLFQGKFEPRKKIEKKKLNKFKIKKLFLYVSLNSFKNFILIYIKKNFIFNKFFKISILSLKIIILILISN